MKLHLAFALLIMGSAVSAASEGAPPGFLTFESGPVRPLALSPDGRWLYSANTPDSRLEVFRVRERGLVHIGSIATGLEPVAVAVRNRREVWVVNHLSDSVSIIDTKRRRVKRTLLVGDEPRDIVFAKGRAFITTAHRGQHRTHASIAKVPGAGDPKLSTPGVPRADVWVFDARKPGPGVGGRPLAIRSFFADTPRALAVSPDGKTVYAAAFLSGNETTVVPEGAVCDGFDPSTACAVAGTSVPGGLPGPATNHAGVPAPEVGLIVRKDPDSGFWRDELGRSWDDVVRFNLPDRDVFAMDARTLKEVRSWPHVGTVLFSMVVNPVSGKLYVSNTEARNEVRFEGPGRFVSSVGAKPPGEPATVQGHLHEARITVIDDDAVMPRFLNKHLDYAQRPALPSERKHSLATPLEMAVSSNGKTLYVAAYGSSRIGVFSTKALENDNFDPRVGSARYITVSGGGPAGIVLDERRRRLYALTRFDNSISVVDLRGGREISRAGMHNPEPPEVVAGRPMLYDATRTSSNGEASCSSCHVFGDLDGLAWNLGNPDGDAGRNPMDIRLEAISRLVNFFGDTTEHNGTGDIRAFNAMKGPMTTQTLRGMLHSGHMHWRGDRADGFFGFDDPNTNDSRLSFRNFIVAFEGLLGSTRAPTDPDLQDDMERFTDFALALTLPPNPVRNLDNTLTEEQAAGREFFFGGSDPENPLFSDGIQSGAPSLPEEKGFTCEGCHTLDPAQGFYGTDGASSFEFETQVLKIPHLRNLYTKVGMFGMMAVPRSFLPGDNEHMGDQIRGFGFTKDGSSDTLFRFFRSNIFDPAFFTKPALGSVGGGFVGGDPQRRAMEQFMFAFPSDLAPVVGQQVTVHRSQRAPSIARADFLLARSETPFESRILGGATMECELVARTRRRSNREQGLLHEGGGRFRSDDGRKVGYDELLSRSLRDPVTFTCVPPGSGRRMALDRDLDGALDALDNCPVAANPKQTDADADHRGDACDERDARS